MYRIEYTPPAHVHIEFVNPLIYNHLGALSALFFRYRMNVHKLTDVGKTIDERAATFDGAVHNSIMYSVDEQHHKKIKRRLQKWMVPVLQHIDALLPHGCCLSLLELFVKIDTAGRIWLLHAGAVKTHLYSPPFPLYIFVTFSYFKIIVTVSSDIITS